MLKSINRTSHYSSFIGGNGVETVGTSGFNPSAIGGFLEINAAGEAYITGNTASPNFPSTPRTYTPVKNAGMDVFVLKMNAAGTAPIFSTFLGSGGNDNAGGIKLKSNGDIVIAGISSSTAFPTTAGCYKAVGTTSPEGFIAILNSNATTLLASTRIGDQSTVVSGVDVDVNDNVYIIGYIMSNTQFPITAGAFLGSFAITGVNLPYCQKYNPTLTTLSYSTFINCFNGHYLFPTDIEVDQNGYAHVVGYKGAGSGFNNCDFTTPCRYNFGVLNNPFNMYTWFIVLNPTATAASYAAYLGGPQVSWGGLNPKIKIITDCTKEVVISFETSDPLVKTTPGAYQTSKLNGGNPSIGNHIMQPVVTRFKEIVNAGFTIQSNVQQCNTTYTFADTTSRCGLIIPSEPATVTWSFGDGNSASGTNVNHTYAGSGTYSVTMFYACPRDTVVHVVNVSNVLTPTITISSVNNISCNGANDGQITVSAQTANGSPSYSWNTGATTNSISGLNANTYSVVVTDGTGCTSTASVIITEPAPLTSSTIVVTNVLCFGTASGTIVIQPTGGTSPYYYTWSNAATTNAVNNLIAGQYTATVSDSHGCFFTQTVVVTEPAALTILITADTAICGQPNGSALAIINGGTQSYSYLWSNTSTTQSISNIVSGVYTLTVTDANNCMAVQSATVESLSPGVVVSFSTTAAEGCAPLCVTFSNTGTDGTLFWNFGDGSTSSVNHTQHCYTVPGLYSVSLTVTDINGCIATIVRTDYITVYSLPTADFTIFPKEPTIFDSQVSFYDRSTDAVQWSWHFGAGTSANSSLQNPTHTYSDTGTYCVTLKVANANLCEDSIVYCLKINPEFNFYIPNSFTPNGDGKNDFLMGYGSGITEYQLWIYNRWGELIYTTGKTANTETAIGWNGSYNNNGKTAQIDVYVWRVALTDNLGKQDAFTGHVNLIR